MQGIQIIGTGRALPDRIVTNDELCKVVDSSDEWIRTRTGICQRYVCANETCVSLASEAARKAINCRNIDIEDIGVVLVATSTADTAFPSTACMVKKELGIPDDVMSFDISAACSGFLYGMEICRGLLLAGKKRYALVIGSEHLSKIMDYEDRASAVLFGDGAAAAVITLADTRYYHKAWSDGNDEVLWCHGPGRETGVLHMQGNKVFRFAVTALMNAMVSILDEASMTLDDIDYVVCHQANIRIIEHVMKKYPGHEHKFYTNIDRYGNTSAASIPIAIDEMIEQGLIGDGKKVLCVGFGAGLTWSSVIITV